MKYLFIPLLFISSFLYAQVVNVDSIYNYYEQQENTPEKVDGLNNLADDLRKESYLDEALVFALKAFHIASRIDDKIGISKSTNFIGLIYRDQSKYSLALEQFMKGMEAAIRTGDRSQIGYSFNNLGTIHLLLSNYEVAMENLISGLREFEAIQNDRGIAYVSLNIGKLLIKQKRPVEAIKYLESVAEFREKVNDYLGLSRTYQYLSEAYSLKKDFKKVEEYLFKTEEFLHKAGSVNPVFYSDLNIQIGDNYLAQKKYDEAASKFNKIIPILENTGDKNNLSYSYLRLGEIYLYLNKLKKAKENIDSGFNLAVSIGSKRGLKDSYRNYSDYFVKVNQPDSSLKYYILYSDLKDQLYDENIIKRIGEIKIQYETNKAIQENENLKTQLQFRERNNVYMAIIIILSIIVLIFTLRSYFIESKRNKKLKELNHTKDKFFSIISHDLRNPFGSIMNYTSLLDAHFDEMNDAEKREMLKMIDNSTKKIYELLDNLLNWARSQKGELIIKKENIDLSNMIHNLSNLVENSLSDKNISLELALDNSIHLFADINTVSTVLHNLVSNAIKFTPKNGKISITSKRENGHAVIKIIDSGIGIDKEDLDKLFRIDYNIHRSGTDGEPGSGLGLILCKEFVDKNHGEIYVNSEVNIGTTFTLKFPTVRI